jgi:hypothetical protein
MSSYICGLLKIWTSQPEHFTSDSTSWRTKNSIFQLEYLLSLKAGDVKLVGSAVCAIQTSYSSTVEKQIKEFEEMVK